MKMPRLYLIMYVRSFLFSYLFIIIFYISFLAQSDKKTQPTYNQATSEFE